MPTITEYQYPRPETRLTASDVAIPASTNPMDEGMQCVELWCVTGVPAMYYPTKIAAEAAARTYFPHEDPDRRYARIFFRRFYTEV